MLLVALSILTQLISSEFWHIILSNAFMGFGYSLKGICDPIFLRNSITEKEHAGTAFAID